MKKFYLLVIFLLSFAFNYAQELIVGGDMAKEDSWIGFWRSDAPDQGVYTFGYADDKPFAGSGGCFEAYGFGQTGLLIYQPVTITPGHKYTFTGAFKGVSPDPLTATWVELILSDTKPDDVGKGDYGAGKADYIYAMNSWMATPFNDMTIDGTFQENFQFTWKNGSSAGADTILSTSGELIIPDTVTITKWWVSFKAGCWNNAGEEVAPFDFLVDDISLIDLGTGNSINLLSTKENLFRLSPNPTFGLVTFTMNNTLNYNYKIADFSGKIVKKGNCSANSTLDISDLNKGIYIVSINSGRTTASQKLVLK
jgi:hypothetical protein